jgi:hypothetical protein
MIKKLRNQDYAPKWEQEEGNIGKAAYIEVTLILRQKLNLQLHIVVFWIMTSYRLTDEYQHFG